MMSIDIQFIWKQRIMKETPLLTHRQSMPILLLPPVSFNAKPHIKFARFFTQIAALSTTPPDRSVATEFLINKCGLTDEDITKAFRHRSSLLNNSSRNLEEVLELLNGCGLTTPAQIRKVVLCNPRFFFYKSERNIKSKLSLLGAFMKEEHISKLFCADARIFNLSEQKLRSSISFLQKSGVDGEALSEMLARCPRLLTASEKKVTESFKQAEDLGFKKGSKMFQYVIVAFVCLGKEKLDRKLQFFSNLGLSEQQLLCLIKRIPLALTLSEEKLKRNMDFFVKTVGLPLADIGKLPELLTYSLETRLIPRYRLMEALKSMEVQVSKKSGPTFASICKITEKRFLEKYVNSNAEFSSILQDIYCKAKAGKLIMGRGDLQ